MQHYTGRTQSVSRYCRKCKKQTQHRVDNHVLTKEGKEYSYDEIKAHGAKHTRKFNEKMLAALLITLHTEPRDADRLAKYFKIDLKKLRQKAAAAVKEEDAAAKLKAKSQGPKAGARA